MEYNFREIEKKWHDYWIAEKVYKVEKDTNKPKYYVLDMFPYPSGAGLHVGHPLGYIASDIYSRFKRLQGFNVLHPMGYDAYGLPAEQYAIQTGQHPEITTKNNIARYREQLEKIGFCYDWSREIRTCDPEYYKWTQWAFIRMFNSYYCNDEKQARPISELIQAFETSGTEGLNVACGEELSFTAEEWKAKSDKEKQEILLNYRIAYRGETMVNWCAALGTVLANDEVVNGVSERGGYPVEQKIMRQWCLRVSAYAQRLLDGLDTIDWTDSLKETQKNWIGRSEGAEVRFKIKDSDREFTIFTTRADTMFGVTFMVIAPEHPIIDKYKDKVTNMDEITAYRNECAKKTEFERTQLVKDKTGVRIQGLEGINPVNGKKIPIYIADYVMMGYGTGAIMAVPAHDQRDYDFAKKFGIDIIEVIKGGDISKEAYTGDGEMVNSEFLNGYTKKKDSIERMLEELEKKGIGKAGVQYKMKDWAFNRQRYWGEPIPLIHCPNCGVVAVPEEELPLRLPDVKDFEPGEDGQSPLAKIDSFVNCTCPKCGAAAKRETDTMPQWAGSSWYFLRYTDPHNTHALADMDKLKYWMPVDWYNGGMEHVTRHMIYSRFWHHFLYDLGVVNTPEPYAKRSIQGLILGPDGDKMSKSKGNVVDPLDIVEEYGADTLRTYVLFMGDYGAATPWSDSSVKGCKKFLDRVAGLTDILSEEPVSEELEMKIHRTIKKVSSDIENLKFNTAIASLMTLINEITAEGHIGKEDLSIFIKLLSPFAPHLCEEIWEFLGGEGLLAVAPWPVYDEGKTVAKTVEIGVQVNGKVRGTVVLPNGCDKEKAFEIAKADERIASFLEGKNLIKEIYVPNKIINFVAK